MSLYFQLLRQFISAGIVFGVVAGLLLSFATNWTIGLSYGAISGCLISLGVPAILTCLSRSNRG